uniref:Uncharacterized protein n=1 Tax=Nothobranchius pienaari TaxID=704102 RepID=A0A1A8MDB7_9TELE
MGADGLTFCNNLAGTREEDDSGTSSPKDMDRSDTEEDPDDREIHTKEREEAWPVLPHNEPLQLEQDWTDGIDATLPGDSFFIMATMDLSDITDKPLNATTQNLSESQHPLRRESKELDLDQSSLELNYEAVKPSGYENDELVDDFLDFSSHENQEVVDSCPAASKQKLVEPLICDNQEVVETCDHGNQEQLSFCHPENQEVLDVDCHENQALVEFCKDESQEFPGNQEVLDLLEKEIIPKENNNQVTAEPEPNLCSNSDSSESDPAPEDLELSNIHIRRVSVSPATLNKTLSNTVSNQDFSISTTQSSLSLLEGDLGSVFDAGGYIGCPDVADDLEPLDRGQENTLPEPVQPVRPVRPPRPSLRSKEKPQPYNIDLK